MDLHERICKYLSRIDPAISGQNGHGRTFQVACALYNGFALTEEQLYSYLELYNQRCQPPWSERELRHKASQAAQAQHTKVRGHLINGNGHFEPSDMQYNSFPPKAASPTPPKPTIDPVTAIEKFLAGRSCSELDLFEASPIKPSEDFTLDGSLLVQHLYHPGELINTVTTWKFSDVKDGGRKCVPIGCGETVERNELLDMWSLGMPQSPCGGWLRMNPVDGNGVADKNVTHHRFILLEFDTIPVDMQLSLLGYLPVPIAAILTSGGKSVHAWVMAGCSDVTNYRDDANMLLTMLSKFGLDTKNKNPSRLSRLPGVTRLHGASGDGRQRLLYLNPNPSQRSVL